MKTVSKKNTIFYCICFALFFMLFISEPFIANADGRRYAANGDSRYQLFVTNVTYNKKGKVRFSYDSRGESFSYTATINDSQVCDLYVFDADGILVAHSRIFNKQSRPICRLMPGNYFFAVYATDEQIESGLLTVK